LTGYKKIENDNEVQADYSVVKEKDDPYPIAIFGLSKPVSSDKIPGYLTGEFYHYLKIYNNTKKYGLPYKNWLEAPCWLLGLIDRFDDIAEEYGRYKKAKGIL
jgi:hypothetical protein